MENKGRCYPFGKSVEGERPPLNALERLKKLKAKLMENTIAIASKHG